jgi:hypothetical protein
MTHDLMISKCNKQLDRFCCENCNKLADVDINSYKICFDCLREIKEKNMFFCCNMRVNKRWKHVFDLSHAFESDKYLCDICHKNLSEINYINHNAVAGLCFECLRNLNGLLWLAKIKKGRRPFRMNEVKPINRLTLPDIK